MVIGALNFFLGSTQAGESKAHEFFGIFLHNAFVRVDTCLWQVAKRRFLCVAGVFLFVVDDSCYKVGGAASISLFFSLVEPLGRVPTLLICIHALLVWLLVLRCEPPCSCFIALLQRS